jgi:hypothetical protein
MAQILKAKYYPKTSFLMANTENRATSYTWYSIQRASWILKKGGLWNIGNGESTSIWNDCWLPRQQGYKVWTPKGDATQKWVKDLMIPNTRWWNRQLVNNIFMPFEAEQILQIPIMNLSRNDEFTWPKSKDGEYTVKSGYQAIKDWNEASNNPSTSINNSPNPIWQKLWNLKIPPNIAPLSGASLTTLYQSPTISERGASTATPYATDVTTPLRIKLMCSVNAYGLSKYGSLHPLR